jgi:CRP/FNR family transcriptional regulator, anaerobic regulatory protein
METLALVSRCFPVVATLPASAQAQLIAGSTLVRLPVGRVLFSAGDACQAYLMVLDGSVRVSLATAGGQGLLLYRVETGQTCVLTTACLLAGTPYDADGAVEQAVTALSVPPALFDALVAEQSSFRAMVFQTFGSRLVDMIALVRGLAFVPVRQRVAAWLLRAAAQHGTQIPVTHAAIAAELGSAREVISRHLEALAKSGCLRVARGHIDILEAAALSTIVEAPV